MKKKDFMERSGKAREQKEIADFINMMEEEIVKSNITGFINGVMSTAQAISENMGYSALAISVSLADRYLQEFAGNTGEDDIPEVYESEETFAQALGEILDGPDLEPHLGAKVAALLERVAGENPKIMRFKDYRTIREKASGYDHGWGPFYFMEDMFFVVFDDLAVLIMLGNDE